MRKVFMPALIAGLLIAACGDDTTGGNGGTGGTPSNGGGGSDDGGGGNGGTADGAGGTGADGGGGNPAQCGDGTVDDSEGCDDGNVTPGDGCDDNCDEEEGFDCAGEPSDCVAVCGDGIVVSGEACDDGNGTVGDGCSDTCDVEEGYDCDDSEPSVCATDCGDGIVAGDEECDDSNSVGSDGCDMLCIVESGYDCTGMPSTCTSECGDGLIAAGDEECDDGDATAGDGCGATCQIENGFSCDMEPSVCTTDCGDGIVAGTEGCDDGDTDNGDGCSDACAEEPGFECTGMPSVCVANCGDGVLAGTEECDDANAVAGDCCDACNVETGCETEPNNTAATADDYAAHQDGGVVYGFVDPSGDANYYSITLTVPSTITATTIDGILGTTCISEDIDSRIRILDSAEVSIISDDDSGPGFCSTATTAVLQPGTYFVVVDASTFDPLLTFDYGLQVVVDGAVCGDGDLDPGEQCDDGNLTPGDGCNATCQAECPGVVESEPNGTFATADVIPPNNIQNCGAITPLADNDFYSFTLTGLSDIVIETSDAAGTFTSCVDGQVDTNLFMLAPDGVTQLANNDDIAGATNRCSRITRTGVTAGTYFARVIEFNNDALIAGYRVKVQVTALCGNTIREGSEECDGGVNCNADCTRVPVCGDTFIDAPEACDDGNTNNGDGCSSTCQVEGIFLESEPNDDGTTAVATNDFSAANADGPFNTTTTIQGAIGVAGDDDVYAVTNTTANPIIVSAETATVADLSACTAITTRIDIRNAANTSLFFDTDSGLGSCSHISFQVAPGETLYVHLIENGDNAAIANYFLKLSFASFTAFTEAEPNDDGTVATGGPTTAGNDFSSANANGPLTVNRLVTGALTPAGDEDVYAITNTSASTVTFDAETFGATVGACGGDTFINVKNAAGVTQLLGTTGTGISDDEGNGACSWLGRISIGAGQTLYVQVGEFGDDAAIASYRLLVRFN